MTALRASVGEVATQIRGVTYKKDEASKDPGRGTIGIVRAGNIQSGEVAFNDLVFVPEGRVKEQQILRQGDVLIAASSGSIDVVGKAGRVRGNHAVAFGGFCKVLRPGPNVDSSYFAHFFQTPEYRSRVSALASGANINNLKNEHLDEFQIPLPPLEEQRRIAAVLDAADALRVKRRQAIAKLDSLTQAIFIDMFGDPSKDRGLPVRKLGDLLESATYGTSRKASSSGAFPVLRMGNLTSNGDLDLAELKYVDLEPKELERHLVSKGDVLFNRTNSPELVGKTALYTIEEPMAYAGYLVRLRPGTLLDGAYLATYMNLASTKAKLRGMCKTIIGMANINAREVQTLDIPFPPHPDQQRFADAVAAVSTQRLEATRQLIKIDELFAALQQRAFRGEL